MVRAGEQWFYGTNARCLQGAGGQGPVSLEQMEAQMQRLQEMQRGMQQGVQQGMQQGVQQGMQQGGKPAGPSPAPGPAGLSAALAGLGNLGNLEDGDMSPAARRRSYVAKLQAQKAGSSNPSDSPRTLVSDVSAQAATPAGLGAALAGLERLSEADVSPAARRKSYVAKLQGGGGQTNDSPRSQAPGPPAGPVDLGAALAGLGNLGNLDDGDMSPAARRRSYVAKLQAQKAGGGGQESPRRQSASGAGYMPPQQMQQQVMQMQMRGSRAPEPQHADPRLLHQLEELREQVRPGCPPAATAAPPPVGCCARPGASCSSHAD